jgi:S-adenosylmethionine hydrolase
VRRPIVFLSDFGLADGFVGVCHGVIARALPDCSVIDLSHGVAPQDVLRGALLLARSVPFMPGDAVYLAVVDPGVGGDRRAVAVEAASGAFLVGPDNGLLSAAWTALGGVTAARSIDADGVVLRPISSTFHGRDVFAPAAAHLAGGGSLERLGPSVDPAMLVRLEVPAARVVAGALACTVLGADRFGNVELSATRDDLRSAGLDGAAELSIEMPRDRMAVPMARTFADVEPGGSALLVDSSGCLTIVVNRASAADRLGLRDGDAVTVRASSGA